MDTILDMCKALADRNRLRVFGLLSQRGELCACQLVELLDVAGPTLSRHMGRLLDSGLVRSRRQGRWVFYRVAEDLTVPEPFLHWVGSTLSQDTSFMKDLEKMDMILARRDVPSCCD